jgi:predicted HAD superfamily phosphohydrolase
VVGIVTKVQSEKARIPEEQRKKLYSRGDNGSCVDTEQLENKVDESFCSF